MSALPFRVLSFTDGVLAKTGPSGVIGFSGSASLHAVDPIAASKH